MGELKDKASRYSDAFDGATPLANKMNRARKAEKIRAILEEEGAFPGQSPRILDIGCSFGIILKTLTPAEGFGVGVDIDANLGHSTDNVHFVRTDAEHLPFASGVFDIIVCNHVYEHTDNPEHMLAEIKRVLSDNGVCYFAGPNKYELVEPHYGLPFLSWLPRALADRYIRLTGKGDRYPEKPYSYPDLEVLLGGFRIISYTEKVLHDPVRYAANDILPPASFKQRFAVFLLKVAPFFFPGFIYILRKDDPSKAAQIHQ